VNKDREIAQLKEDVRNAREKAINDAIDVVERVHFSPSAHPQTTRSNVLFHQTGWSI
jgi:hypothetical protein